MTRYVSALLICFSTAFLHAQDGLEKEIRKFIGADLIQPPAKGQIVLWGSSSLRLWSSAEKDLALNGLSVINRGFGGSQASDANKWFEQVIVPLQPAWIIYYEGDNDLNAGKTVDQVYADVKKSIQLVRKKLPQTRLLVLAIKPSHSRLAQMPAQQALNIRVKNLCHKKKNTWWVDTASPVCDPATRQPDAKYFKSDQLHLNELGYTEWTRVIREVLEKH